jgi:6-phosphogluconolactonase (cycloisomerase 2 family)
MHWAQVPLRCWCWLIVVLATLSSCATAGLHPHEPRAATPAKTKVAIYAGIGPSIHVYGLDTQTGELDERQTVADLQGVVQYVAVHPSRKFLYVSCSEMPTPADRPPESRIYAFAIDPATGALARLGDPYEPPLSRAVHIAVDNTGRYLLMAHNTTESVSVLRLRPDGGLGESIAQPASPQRLGFLVHQVRIDPSNKWVLVPVRGDDEKPQKGESGAKGEPEKFGHLVVFEFNEGVLTKSRTIDYPSRVGPRHLDFHPSKPLIYVSMERGNRILTYKNDNGVLTELFDTTTLEHPGLQFPDQRAGPIRVHPSGTWVYVANRNTAICPPSVGCAGRADSLENDVAVFSIDPQTGAPKLIQNEAAHGFEPRTMTIDPSLHFLIVANQKEVSFREPEHPDRTVKVGPNFSVFRIGDDGKLTYVRSYDVTAGEPFWVGAVALP